VKDHPAATFENDANVENAAMISVSCGYAIVNLDYNETITSSCPLGDASKT
jgi:hypothetical protein